MQQASQKKESIMSAEHHKEDLKEAIYYLSHNVDPSVICTALKIIYPNQGKELAIEWHHKLMLTLPSRFDEMWEAYKLTSYQLHTLDDYLNQEIYSLAKQFGRIPKAFRKGKNTKRPLSRTKLKHLAGEFDLPDRLQANLKSAHERFIPDEMKSFIPTSIVNLSRACYYHPFMKKEEIPDNQSDYLAKLTKNVDCEVRVLEAIEYVTEQQGRMSDDKEVRYKLELND